MRRDEYTRAYLCTLRFVTSFNNMFAFNEMLCVFVTSFNNMLRVFVTSFNEMLRVLVTSFNNMLRVVHDTYMVYYSQDVRLTLSHLSQAVQSTLTRCTMHSKM